MSARGLRTADLESLARKANYHPATMADLYPISLRQLDRLFARRFRLTPELWCRKLRGTDAIALLSRGYSTKAVAIELGFSNESHLCHEFAKLFGKSPQFFAPKIRKAARDVA